MKTAAQRRYEASLRRNAIAHPAAPAENSGWSITCERTGCDTTFVSPTRQRKYCSDRCRRLVEKARQRRLSFVEGLLLMGCAAPRCREVFVPVSPEHQYCSAKCRKRAHRAHSHLGATKCVWCGTALPETATRRRKYCGARCRKRAARAKNTQREPEGHKRVFT